MSPTHPNPSRRDRDLALLAAADETGWWDEHGRPAPWPEDFWLADGTINPDWQQNNPNPKEEPATTTSPDDHDF